MTIAALRIFAKLSLCEALRKQLEPFLPQDNSFLSLLFSAEHEAENL